MTPEVVVVGGGPAGLSAGVELAKQGISVLVCESSSNPGNKPCGEGLLPGALRELGQLGLDEAELLAAGRPLLGVRYTSAAGRRAESSFPDGHGLGLKRCSLLRLLRALAERTPHLRLLKADARIVVQRGERLGVRIDGRLIAPRLVVAADGLNSRARKAAGVIASRPRPFRYGLRQHFRVRSWTEHVEVYFSANAEAYVTPTHEDEINVALLWQARDATDTRVGSRVPDLVDAFPALAQRLACAVPAQDARAYGPLRVDVPTPARDGLVLLGDAAGYVDAITGEGVGLAVAKARALARWLLPELRTGGGQLRLRQLAPYLAAARKLERHHVSLTRLLLVLRRSPALTERIIAALGNDPQLFGHFLAANQGGRSPYRVPWRSALSLAWSLAQAPSAPRAIQEPHALPD
jgi:flavin-dependent dehydrogenase